MTYPQTKYITATITSGTSGGTAAVVELGRPYRNMAIFHSGVSGAMTLYGSSDGSTIKPVWERLPTGTVQYQVTTFPSTISGVWCQNACPPVSYIHFVATGTCANGASIQVALSD